jgi:hypothetical protein
VQYGHLHNFFRAMLILVRVEMLVEVLVRVANPGRPGVVTWPHSYPLLSFSFFSLLIAIALAPLVLLLHPTIVVPGCSSLE